MAIKRPSRDPDIVTHCPESSSNYVEIWLEEMVDCMTEIDDEDAEDKHYYNIRINDDGKVEYKEKGADWTSYASADLAHADKLIFDFIANNIILGG